MLGYLYRQMVERKSAEIKDCNYKSIHTCVVFKDIPMILLLLLLLMLFLYLSSVYINI